MKDLIILTDEPIWPSSCDDLLIKKFKRLELLNHDDTSLYMKRKKRGFELWFSPNDILDDPQNMMEDTIDKCPNKKAYLTNLSYTSKNIARNVIDLMKPLFGNMWIQSDEEDNWFGTADEFINEYCSNN